MSSCCSPAVENPVEKGALTIALAGNPNSGKTTIFNGLTGLRQKVANYPGVTVEKKTGRCHLPDGRWASVIDLPGTYSLISRSPDEHIAAEVLRGLRADTPAPDVIVAVIDASNLQRNLYLVSQLIELGRPMVIALNMIDVAENRGINVSPEALSRELGVPVVPIVGHRRRGLKELKAAILNAQVAPDPEWNLPEPFAREIKLVAQQLDGPRATVVAERLLIGDPASDLQAMRRDGVSDAVAAALVRLQQAGVDPMQADIEAHYRWIDTISNRSSTRRAEASNLSTQDRLLPYATPPASTFSESLDAVLMHKVWGLVIFAMLMAGLFVAIFFLADPLMGLMEEGVALLGSLVEPLLPAEGPIKDLWTDGIVAGVGGVVVFVPQIAMLFLFLAIMEDSGYLARAAFLMDRVLSKVGLHGKSFIPLLSSFACAIPGIMATRTIEDRRDRLATIFVAPFMSCSARLPVYFLLIGTFFASYSAWTRGGIMAACYLLGIVAAAATAWIFKRSMLKGTRPAFILEMPTYKFPQIGQIARTVWTNTWAFLVKAGTIIFVLSIILWAMTYYPRLPEERIAQIQAEENQNVLNAINIAPETFAISSPIIAEQVASVLRDEEKEAVDEFTEKRISSEQLRHSIAGRFGHVLEPVIRPLGYDWKMGVGLFAAFAAREVFVSHMGIVYSVGDDMEETGDLEAAMLADTYPDGRPVWTPVVAISLLVWFVLAMQCMSTLAVVKRETGFWAWPVYMMLYMNGLAYVVALAVYQIGTRIG